MPASRPDRLLQPKDISAAIWRYMDVSKFLMLFLNEELFVPRMEFLGDSFEGSLSPKSFNNLLSELHKQTKDILTQNVETGVKTSDAKELDLVRTTAESFLGNAKVHQKTSYVSCWHMNEYESAAMWKQYSSSNDAIAIRSTYQKLANLFDDRAVIGLVKYIDYNTEGWPPFNVLDPLYHKRMSFSHEREVRVVQFHRGTSDGPIDLNALPAGIKKPFSFNDFIDFVYVSPTSSSWLAESMEKLLQLKSVNVPIQRSELSNSPFF